MKSRRPSTPHVEAARGAEELIRALRYVALGVTAFRQGTFQPAPDLAFVEGFRRWVHGPFRWEHGPHFSRVVRAASHEGAREVAELDRAYDRTAFPSPEAATRLASLELGSHLVGALDGARHARLPARIGRALEEGELPGHFATLLACHAATLHVPVRHGLVALAFFEWRFAGGLRRVEPQVAPDDGFAFDAEDAGLDAAVAAVMQDGGADGPVLFACA